MYIKADTLKIRRLCEEAEKLATIITESFHVLSDDITKSDRYLSCKGTLLIRRQSSIIREETDLIIKGLTVHINSLQMIADEYEEKERENIYGGD